MTRELNRAITMLDTFSATGVVPQTIGSDMITWKTIDDCHAENEALSITDGMSGVVMLDWAKWNEEHPREPTGKTAGPKASIPSQRARNSSIGATEDVANHREAAIAHTTAMHDHLAAAVAPRMTQKGAAEHLAAAQEHASLAATHATEHAKEVSATANKLGTPEAHAAAETANNRASLAHGLAAKQGPPAEAAAHQQASNDHFAAVQQHYAASGKWK